MVAHRLHLDTLLSIPHFHKLEWHCCSWVSVHILTLNSKHILFGITKVVTVAGTTGMHSILHYQSPTVYTQLCEELGLEHISRGQGKERYIEVRMIHSLDPVDTDSVKTGSRGTKSTSKEPLTAQGVFCVYYYMCIYVGRADPVSLSRAILGGCMCLIQITCS